MMNSTLASRESGNEQSEESSSDWDFEAELALLNKQLNRTTESDKIKVRNLIGACLKITRNSSKIPESSAVAGDQFVNQNTSSHQNHSAVNPFDIHLVFNEILGYLPMDSLFNCRFVNRSWKAKAIPWIQEKKITPVFLGLNNFQKFCADFSEAEILPVVKLSLELEALDFTADHCKKFFMKHGSQIRELEIVECKARGFKESWAQNNTDNLNKIRHILRRVPKLKKLSLDLSFLPEALPDKFVFDEPGEVVLPQVEYLTLCSLAPLGQEFFEGLLVMLPRIKTVHLGHFCRDQDWDVLASALKSIRALHMTLRVSNDLEAPWRALAAQSSLKLNELSMTTAIDGDAAAALEHFRAQEYFLQSQAESLEKFTLKIRKHGRIPNTNPRPNLQLPIMKSLKYFKIRPAWAASIENPMWDTYPLIPIESDQVPNLRTLCIDPRLIERDHLADSIFTSVQELDLMGKEYNIHLATEISARFLNLKKLSNFKIRSDQRGAWMPMIVRYLSQIEDLEITFVDYSDGKTNFNLAVSGIPVKSQWALSQVANRVGHETLASWIDPTKPSLRDLKRLKRLVLTFDAAGNEDSFARLDEFVVYSTLLHMPAQLELSLRGDFSIREDLAAQLTAHYQNVYIVPNDPKTKDESDEEDESNSYICHSILDSDSDSEYDSDSY